PPGIQPCGGPVCPADWGPRRRRPRRPPPQRPLREADAPPRLPRAGPAAAVQLRGPAGLRPELRPATVPAVPPEGGAAGTEVRPGCRLAAASSLTVDQAPDDTSVDRSE